MRSFLMVPFLEQFEKETKATLPPAPPFAKRTVPPPPPAPMSGSLLRQTHADRFEEKVPPELEFRLFVENACAGPITPAEVLELPLYAARTDYGFEYVLPSRSH